MRNIQVFQTVFRVEDAINEIRKTLESGWASTGPKTEEFESMLSSMFGGNHVCATNSCTAALHMAIKLLNLDKGSKVLTTPNTFVSTNHAILYEGLVPVFCDIDKTTGNLSTEYVEKTVRCGDIRAIMAVHLGGYPCNMQEINEIAEKFGVPVIEDCAHAMGAMYRNGKYVGDTNNICCFSFHAVKNMPIGDGGAISVPSKSLYDRIKKLRWMGIDKDTASRSKGSYKWEYNVEEIGYKYGLNDILSSLGIVGLRYIDQDNARRRAIAKYYRDNIVLNGVTFPNYSNFDISSSHFMPVFFEDRDKVYVRLFENGIFPGMHYKMNYRYDVFEKYERVNGCRNAEWYESHELTLPMHLGLTDHDLKEIVDVINGG